MPARSPMTAGLATTLRASSSGTNLRFARPPPAADDLVPKVPSPEEIHIVVAGGTAGRFSVAVPGWLGTKNGSRPVTRAIENGLT